MNPNQLRNNLPASVRWGVTLFVAVRLFWWIWGGALAITNKVSALVLIAAAAYIPRKLERRLIMLAFMTPVSLTVLFIKWIMVG